MELRAKECIRITFLSDGRKLNLRHADKPVLPVTPKMRGSYKSRLQRASHRAFFTYIVTAGLAKVLLWANWSERCLNRYPVIRPPFSAAIHGRSAE
jgi:hypothetical protein